MTKNLNFATKYYSRDDNNIFRKWKSYFNRSRTKKISGEFFLLHIFSWEMPPVLGWRLNSLAGTRFIILVDNFKYTLGIFEG